VVKRCRTKCQGTLRALVRRGSTVRTTETLVVGSLVLNRVTHACSTPARALLTARVQFLQHFMLHAGDVVSRTELLEKSGT